MHDSEFGSSPLAITDQCAGNKQSRRPGREGFAPDEAFPSRAWRSIRTPRTHGFGKVPEVPALLS
jgi:hypothetical protein